LGNLVRQYGIVYSSIFSMLSSMCSMKIFGSFFIGSPSARAGFYLLGEDAESCRLGHQPFFPEPSPNSSSTLQGRVGFFRPRTQRGCLCRCLLSPLTKEPKEAALLTLWSRNKGIILSLMSSSFSVFFIVLPLHILIGFSKRIEKPQRRVLYLWQIYLQ